MNPVVRSSIVQFVATGALVSVTLYVFDRSVAWGWVVLGMAIVDALLGCGKVLLQMKRGE